MREVAGLALRAVPCLHKVLTDLSFVEQRDCLSLRCLLAARGGVNLVVVDFAAVATRHGTVGAGLFLPPRVYTLL